QNFINSDLDPGMIRSMFCRLQLDLRELLKRGNGLFGSAELTGSIGVVTVNMARLGHLYAGDEPALIRELDRLLEGRGDTLGRRRQTVHVLGDGKPNSDTVRYLGHLGDDLASLEVNGMKEMVFSFTGDHHVLTDEAGQVMSVRILEHVRVRMVAMQE